MKKFITTILALVYMLGGCTAADFKNNTSNDSSEEISIEASEAVSSEESADSDTETSEESKAESDDSSESSDSSEESFEDISSDVSSEELSEDVSSEESREEDTSSAPVTPPVGGDNGNESKPEEDVSSSTPDVSEPEKDESKGDVPTTHTHSYTATVKAATCTTEGYTEYKCECGDSYKADYTAKTEHQWGPWFVSKDATTTEDGSRERGCTICYNWEYETIPMIVVTITQEDLDYMAECALEMLNEQRVAAGLQPLVTGPIAHQMASERAKQLSEYFSHQLPDGRGGPQAVYFKFKYNADSEDGDYMPEAGGENIAKSSMSVASISTGKKNYLKVHGRGLMGGFQLSSGHWGDLMDDDYTACGVGVYVEKISDERYITYICVMTMDKLYGTDAA